MVQAVAYRIEKYITRDTLTSSDWETVPSFLQSTVTTLSFAAMMRDKGGERMGHGGKQGSFARI